MSNVNERQKRHREHHIKKGAKRLDMLISKESSHQLTMIALYGRGGMKKKHVIEYLLKQEYDRLMSDSDNYFEKLVKDIRESGVDIE